MKSQSAKIIPIYICTAFLLLMAGCAQMIPLSGGEKDETPPVIKSQTPENKTTSFSGNEIKIEFDEYIQLKDLQNQLIITPKISEDPDVSASGKILHLKFKKPLEPNTTYNVNFGSSIADVHEGNVLAGLNVIFSTGPQLDSLSVSGKITDAFTLKASGDCSVFLYANGNDSCMFRSKPDYFAKAGTDGSYSVNYVKAGKYKVIAISDKNRNYTYDQGDEYISPVFNDQNGNVELIQSIKQDFSVFKEAPSRLFVKRTLSAQYGKTQYSFNKTSDSLSVEFLNGGEKRAQAVFSDKMDTLTVFYLKGKEDSISFLLKRAGKTLEKLVLTTQDEEKYEKDLKLKRLSPKLKKMSSIFAGKISSMEFDQPIIAADNKKILFVHAKDTFRIKEQLKILGNGIYWSNSYDSTGKTKLLLLPGAVKSFNEVVNDSIEQNFDISTQEENGILNLNIELPGEGTYILQLISEKGAVHPVNYVLKKETDKKTASMHIERIAAGNYSMRIWKDNDKNNEWSSGNLLMQVQPEKIWYYTKPVKLLGDWEITVEWKIED